MNMDGKTVIVAGLGVSGQSMMEVLGSRAGRVLGVDEKKPDADLHSFDQIDWDNTDMVMTSPVFNPRTPFILEAQKRNIPVMSEVELAWQLRVNSNTTGKPAQWIGITGTNGKTSTTEMTSEMLTACGLAAPGRWQHRQSRVARRRRPRERRALRRTELVPAAFHLFSGT